MKVLILTASPIRDSIVDILLAQELQKYGHEVFVRPCLREGRKAVLEVQPDTVVTPPIRNPYSRDMVEVLKDWGIGVISRHTEPSCDWHDFKKMDSNRQHEIFGQYPYKVDAELVWSQDEAEILNQRDCGFKAYPIGATTADAYKHPEVIAQYRNRATFNAKYKFDDTKKNLLICSPWGFVDSAPDLHVEEVDEAKKDVEGRDRHFTMIRTVSQNLKDKWNILVSVHPGVVQKPYQDLCTELGIPLDTESTSFILNIHSDAIIHAGSTMALNAHWLGIPAFQFGDINAKDSKSWWSDPESSISKVSPYFKAPEDLMQALIAYKPGSNANMQAIEALEKGRFGNMDGQSTVRAAEIINKIQGKFKFCWPRSTKDYSQLTILRDARRLLTSMKCGICGNDFVVVNDSWLEMLRSYTGFKGDFRPPHGSACPHCAARWYAREVE